MFAHPRPQAATSEKHTPASRRSREPRATTSAPTPPARRGAVGAQRRPDRRDRGARMVHKSRRPARAGLRASEVRRCLQGEVRTEGSRPTVAFSQSDQTIIRHPRARTGDPDAPTAPKRIVRPRPSMNRPPRAPGSREEEQGAGRSHAGAGSVGTVPKPGRLGKRLDAARGAKRRLRPG
jgi:hypothetical protein